MSRRHFTDCFVHDYRVIDDPKHPHLKSIQLCIWSVGVGELKLILPAKAKVAGTYESLLRQAQRTWLELIEVHGYDMFYRPTCFEELNWKPFRMAFYSHDGVISHPKFYEMRDDFYYG